MIFYQEESSIFSALRARRKVAMMSLRSSLDQAALGLYYGEDGRKHAFQNSVESGEEPF